MPITIKNSVDDTLSNESLSKVNSNILTSHSPSLIPSKSNEETSAHSVSSQILKPNSSSFDYHEEKSFIDESFKKHILYSQALNSSAVDDITFKTALMSVEDEVGDEINTSSLANRRLSDQAKMSIPDTFSISSLHPGNVKTHLDANNNNTNDATTNDVDGQTAKKDRSSSYRMGYKSNSLEEFNDVSHFQLMDIFGKIKKCQELRKSYQFNSVQLNEQNPKNKDDWEIYPEPPKPSYDAATKTEIKVENKPDWETFDINKVVIPEHTDEDNEFDYTLNADGSYVVFYKNQKDEKTDRQKLISDKIPTLREYYIDLEYIANLSSDGPMKSFAFKRLQFLEARWAMYSLLNEFNEIQQNKTNPIRDF